MKLFIIALLAAISYAQTDPAAGGAGMMDPMMYGMYDEIMDLGDMYPEVGDLYDNIGYALGGMGIQLPGAGGAGAGAAGGMPMFGGYGDINDMMSDVVDNMKDGDIYDVMENLLPMAGMGVPGIDMNSIMSGGMPNLNGIMNAVSPYLAMDGDFYGDFGDLYKFGSDMYEDFYKYGMGMGGGMGGMGGMPSMALRKNRVAHKRHRAHKPSRLLKRTGNKKHLRHTREFPFFALASGAAPADGSAASSSPFPFLFDTPDSEDLAAFLMMGGNKAAVPPPLDGIDGEDLWMYRGTKWDPFKAFGAATTTTNADGTTTQQAPNPWLYALLSGLQKRHMQKKY